MDNIHIPKEWEQIADQIKYTTKTCIVIGKTDSGKSTFCKFLIHYWASSGICVGYVDSDLGQSTIGLPATVAVKTFPAPYQRIAHSGFTDFHFVGNTSPEGFLLQTLHAVRLMVKKSYHCGAEITLVDTTGFVDGPVARVLKLHKIEMLSPQWIIALQADDEIEHLLKGYEKMGKQVIRLARPEHVIARSQSERQIYRAKKYRDYFTPAKIRQHPLREVTFPSCILGTGQRVDINTLPERIFLKNPEYLYLEKCGTELLIIADRPDVQMPFYELKKFLDVTSVLYINRLELKHLLVGLGDKDGNTLGLGTIINLDPVADELTLFTPVQDIHKIVTIHPGALKIEEGERETGKVRAIHYVR